MKLPENTSSKFGANEEDIHKVKLHNEQIAAQLTIATTANYYHAPFKDNDGNNILSPNTNVITLYKDILDKLNKGEV